MRRCIAIMQYDDMHNGVYYPYFA